jgi:hypothetical protein
MSKPERRPDAVLRALREACAAHPDQRVMQVVINALGVYPFDVEDEDASAKLDAYTRAADAPINYTGAVGEWTAGNAYEKDTDVIVRHEIDMPTLADAIQRELRRTNPGRCDTVRDVRT